MATGNSDLMSTRCKKRHSRAKISCLVLGFFLALWKEKDKPYFAVSQRGRKEWSQKTEAVQFLSGRNASHVSPGRCYWGGELIMS